MNPKKSQKHALKGLQSERRVIEHLRPMKWELEFQRAKTRVAEVDLVFRRGHDVRLIEVKSLNNPWRAFDRISDRQIQKLVANQLHFSSLLGARFEVRCYVAWVSEKQIDFVRVN